MKTHIEEIKRKILPILQRYGVKKVGLFGSFIRGEMREDSDIDILVEIKKDISLLDFVGIKLEIEEALGRKMDAIVTTSLGQRMNPARIAEAIRRVGPESTILATDFGQADNPSPVEGLRSYVRSMLKEGLREKEINLMSRVNPCELLKVKRRRPEMFFAKTT
ncbi:MAG: hypothetical protein E3J23_06225, partial [Candidatus Stahlbacteria bacterium]